MDGSDLSEEKNVAGKKSVLAKLFKRQYLMLVNYNYKNDSLQSTPLLA